MKLLRDQQRASSHEDQDEREGWQHEIELIRARGDGSEITESQRKGDAMKTKTNVKAGFVVH
jgi:hypothetical protein